MKYIALLRGINVGGKAKVPMSDLKTVFTSLGCDDVATYINSGNVFFSDARSALALMPVLERAIEARFGFFVPVLVKSQAAIVQLNADIPANWTHDDQQKTDVIFLWPDVDTAEILDRISYKPDIETIKYYPGAVIWNISRENATRGSTPKLVANELYQRMTIRNINTLRKLANRA